MVRGRFCVKRCGPSRHCLRDTSAVLENFARHPKKTLSTLSAHFGSFARVPRRPLMMRERSSRAPHFITFDPRNKFFRARQINVRSWGKSGRHLLVLSVSQFDPEQTSPRAGVGIPRPLSPQAPRPFACPCKCVRAEQETLDYRSTSQRGSG